MPSISTEGEPAVEMITTPLEGEMDLATRSTLSGAETSKSPVADSQPVSTAPSLDGAELFRAKGCASCHDGPNSTALIGGFPPLVDATDWAGQRRPEMTARAYLAESINEPNVFISPTFAGGNGPTTAMPKLSLTSDEVDALIDYLLSK